MKEKISVVASWISFNGSRSFRLQVDSPTLKTIRLHVLRRFAYAEVDKTIRLHVLRCFPYTEVDSPTRSEMFH